MDEQVPPGMSATTVAEHLALQKAAVFPDRDPGNLILTADTVVAFRDHILGKPRNHREAAEMLGMLSGQTHYVVTGVCIAHKGERRVFHELTHVRFRQMGPWEINHYIQRYQPFDKAGAYGIQEWIGMIGIESIEGDYYNVMGLPIHRLWQELGPWMTF